VLSISLVEPKVPSFLVGMVLIKLKSMLGENLYETKMSTKVEVLIVLTQDGNTNMLCSLKLIEADAFCSAI
jgi:hypothetical protein